MAVWDLSARLAGEPLYRHLGADRVDSVSAYASRINATGPEAIVAHKQEEGYRCFKLKVGSGREQDLRDLRSLREMLGTEAPLMIDANQAWDVATAAEMARTFEPFGPDWLEEPVRADVPVRQWADLARRSPIPLAAGENVQGEVAFVDAIASMGLRCLQPDIGRWGGFTGCLPVGRTATASRLIYCPHWLGGGIGLVASLHLLAAVGGEGALEVDVNSNPLREICLEIGPLRDGRITVPGGPGMGVVPGGKGHSRLSRAAVIARLAAEISRRSGAVGAWPSPGRT